MNSIIINEVSGRFRKSSYSKTNDCVEVADAPGTSAMRDTRHRDLGSLHFGSPEWQAFIEAAKHGEI
ncbi:DUF397 domain-containing protein [Nocardiopsis suaedae]|uniref:DUF397 domain-containing protein n=1 Tax=Nocardiopsis suaedae TaxID=3018444 RepID=A0ABT4TPS4_9ACTN|nr:DUF397 domain-containing protein [Nocardiopsis suaedae]MDA2806688.1 DUF397 domain-containing protein [Nocardiopsis suaedae]